jgi:vitamin K-dependent gamma-carboxylase
MTTSKPHRLPKDPRWITRCFEPIDIAALIYFRIAFGALMVWEIWRCFVGHRLNSLWIQPEFHFKYFGFDWVQPPPGDWIYVLFAVLLTSAAGVTIGLCYRLCAILFALGFTWLFLIDAAQYLNHFYLICLLGFVSILLPANRRLAVDSLRKPSLRSDIAPAWTLWLLRGQMAIVYFYGGIAKLNPDWLHGEPPRTWLGWRAHDSRLEDLLRSEWTVGLISYGGLLFDLFIVPLLFWRKTRLLAFALAAAFHLTNNWLFNIGIFPWLAIAVGRRTQSRTRRVDQRRRVWLPPSSIDRGVPRPLSHLATAHAAAPFPLSRRRELDRRRAPLLLAHEAAF